MENTTTQKLEVAKEFSVPVSKIYKAWITAEDLKAWWQPMNSNLTEVENSVKQGGDIKYVFANEDGDGSFSINGTYKEVAQEKRLVYTWNWEVSADGVGDSNYLLSVSFTDLGGNRSRLEVVQEDFNAEESIKPHQEGWEKALADLEHYLSNQA